MFRKILFYFKVQMYKEKIHMNLFTFILYLIFMFSLHTNPLARGPGEVKLDSDNFENYERICLNK